MSETAASPSPYALSARAYFDAGWSPIPLPFRSKSPVPDKPTAFTGAKGAYVDGAQLRRWLAHRARANAGNLSYPPGNVAIRLPRDIIGIDLDAYGEKKGAVTFAKAEEEWGPLPKTWVSTSKDDGTSGIRLYRIPEGLSWPGELPQGKGVELLRWDHRYMLVSPSVHDLTGEVYRWCKEELLDEVLYLVEVEEFPDADALDIPTLPEEWVTGLTSGKRWEERAATEELSDAEIEAWFAARPSPDSLCSSMRSTLSKGKTKVQVAGDDGGAHDIARDVAWGLINDAKAGHPGIRKALTELKNVFLQAIKGRRESERQARTEWRRIVNDGISKVAGDDNAYEKDDPCGLAALNVPAAKATGGGRIGSDAICELNERGNADRFVRVFAGRARWVPAWGIWVTWDGTKWAPDEDGQVERWAVRAVDEIDEEAAFLAGEEDAEKRIKAFKAHQKATYKMGALRSGLDMVKSRKGITVRSETFDADPRLLGVGNGVLRLGDDGVTLGSFEPAAFLTKNTGVPWVEGAAESSPMWNAFLTRFQPDEEVREWLQRITGASLRGECTGRYIVALVGRTSTGKSTFAEVIRRVLGDYAGAMPASILRDNQDDRARPDLLRAIGHRIIIAEELSAAQHLHVDQIKRITGLTPITARGMRSNVYISQLPAFNPWIVTNEVPTIEGADNALERRLLPVPFNTQISQQEERLGYIDDLLAEASTAVLDWAVQGYRKFLRSKDLAGTRPAGALAVALAFKEGMNDFNAFCSDRLEFGDDFYAFPASLYQEYQTWCSENGVKERDVLSGSAFGRKLSSIDCGRVSKRVNGKPGYVRGGVRIAGDMASRES